MFIEFISFTVFIIMLYYLHRDHMRRRAKLERQFAALYAEIKKLKGE